ncbi:MAG: TrkH family potassium uptake protein [Lachnospiraceae bacterium]
MRQRGIQAKMGTTGKRIHRHITSFQVIILGFFTVILLGSLLLTLPVATQDGQGATFADALFTATSAVCVTGLVVHDTATYWSMFGQAVIMLLIQIGGMGVVTIAVAIATASGRKIGLMQRSVMQEAISAHQVGGIVRMTKFILKTSMAIELVGAVFLAFVFVGDFGMQKGLWYGLFHSVSAFCNAGFDLIGIREPFSSLTSYASQPIVNLTIMALIVTGGLGFLTWADIQKNKWNFKKYRMQSKVILSVTAGLILVPAVYFFFCEFSSLPFAQRVWSSLFQSVTPRTAGFNTADLTMISETGLMLMIVLMLIGGSPGSTAGGMKTTTIAVLFSSALAVFKKKESPHFYGRRISDDAVKNAATILLMYVTLFLGGGMVISSVEKIPLVSALFETSSAIGTVGLSLGITPTLSGISRAILIGLMFFGRVGGLTLIFAAFSEHRGTNARLPQEKITVG